MDLPRGNALLETARKGGECEAVLLEAASVPDLQRTLMLLNETGILVNLSDMDHLDRRRLELEKGKGGDHDLPYVRELPNDLGLLAKWAALVRKVEPFVVTRKAHDEGPDR